MNALAETFAIIFDATWRVSLLILTLLILRPFLRNKVSAWLVHTAWVVLALRLLLPFSLPTRWSPYNLSSALAPTMGSTTFNPPEPIAAPTPSSPQPSSPAAPDSAPTPAAAPLGLYHWASAAWLTGLVALLTHHIRAHRRFRRTLTPLALADALSFSTLLRRCAEEIGVRHVPELATSSLVASPALYGIFRTRILLPADARARYSAEELRFILLHELGHHRRRDLLAQTLLSIAVAVHWFNPLVWIAARIARRDCEYACDEYVLNHTRDTDRDAYGHTLLKVAHRLSHPSPFPAAVGILENKNQIRKRILMITRHRYPGALRTLAGAALLALFTSISLTKESYAQAPTSLNTATPKAPEGWWKNGANKENYEVGLDPTQMRSGQPSAYAKSSTARVGDFGGMMQMCDAELYRGKRVRLSAWLKTQDALNGANLWFRIDGSTSGKSLGFDNMEGREPKGTTPWTHYSIVLDVPETADALAYGFFLSSSGQAWVSGFKLEEVGAEISSTERTKPQRPKQPVNLNFAQP